MGIFRDLFVGEPKYTPKGLASEFDNLFESWIKYLNHNPDNYQSFIYHPVNLGLYLWIIEINYYRYLDSYNKDGTSKYDLLNYFNAVFTEMSNHKEISKYYIQGELKDAFNDNGELDLSAHKQIGRAVGIYTLFNMAGLDAYAEDGYGSLDPKKLFHYQVTKVKDFHSDFL